MKLVLFYDTIRTFLIEVQDIILYTRSCLLYEKVNNVWLVV